VIEQGPWQPGEWTPRPSPSRQIAGWSRKSRANMVRVLAELDYRPMFTDPTVLPAITTLTYPAQWEEVAPSGRAVKRHMDKFRKRFERAWGRSLVGVWKLEFQARGAPHLHVWMIPPHGQTKDGRQFRQWLSETWAAIVAHPDPEQRRRHQLAGTGVDFAEGLRAKDPRRLAIYFSKHGSWKAKDYQNIVPEPWREPGQGPGRFWGYWKLERVASIAEVSPEDGLKVARTMRRWARAQRTTREATVWRTRGGAPRSCYPDVIGLAGAQLVQSRHSRTRKVRRRVRRLSTGRGFLIVNDGAAFAADLARAAALP
ncbi:MAG: rolling circle replication-associated protein, partial [Nocardioidaceae bacterium]